MKSFFVSIIIASVVMVLHAAESDVEPNKNEEQKNSALAQAGIEKISITHHTININGKSLPYWAVAGYTPIKNDANKTVANVFFVAYTRDDEKDASQKPVSFAFNGGPGSSSIWLHMGALGPKRVVLADNGTVLPKTYELVDNEYTWLRFTDLVFVDPVGTGFSRAAADTSSQQFYNMSEDVNVMGEFIRLYITNNQRWLSPKYLIGESYGTTRAADLAEHLRKSGMLVNGLVLISTALDFELFSYDQGNDIAYILAVPSYTAAAWYHKKLPEKLQDDLPKTLEQAREWAINVYMPALAKGSALSESESSQIIEKLAQFTGLSKSYVEKSQMRIPSYRYIVELLRDSSCTIGMLDSRVKAPDISAVAEYPFEDPSMNIVKGPFVAVFNDYVRTVLDFKTDLPYKALSDTINESWKWSKGQQGYVNVSHKLTEALSSNEYLRVFVATGYFDLTTPWLSQEYTFTHLGLLNPALRSNITHHYYESGHQIYTSIPALQKLTEDVSMFFEQKQ
jgi:carboxypeptidase C (cathepsin A)